MSKPKPQSDEVLAKKKARRVRRKAAIASGLEMQPPAVKRRSGITDHGNSPRKRKRARDGEARIERERGGRGASANLVIVDELHSRCPGCGSTDRAQRQLINLADDHNYGLLCDYAWHRRGDAL